MIQKIKNKILAVNELVSLEINISEEGSLIIMALHIKNIKGKISKINEYQKIESLEEFAEKISKKLPLVITLNGKGILFRKKETEMLSNPVADFLPGSNPSQFYFQVYSASSVSYAFIARKELVDGILNKILSFGFTVLSISAGISGIENVLPLLNNNTHKIKTFSYEIECNSNQIAGLEPFKLYNNSDFEEYLIGSEYYKSNSLIALGAAIEIFIQPVSTINTGIETERITEIRTNFINYKYYSVTGWAILLSLLIILLSNYFAFNYYYKQNQELTAIQMLSTEKVLNAQKLKAKLDSGFSFLQNAGWDKPSRHSYFIDRLAALVPGSVVLTSINSSPLDETADNKETFIANKIIITGTCEDPADLNIFINSVKNLDEIRNVSLSGYLYKKELELAVFTLEISLS